MVHGKDLAESRKLGISIASVQHSSDRLVWQSRQKQGSVRDPSPAAQVQGQFLANRGIVHKVDEACNGQCATSLRVQCPTSQGTSADGTVPGNFNANKLSDAAHDLKVIDIGMFLKSSVEISHDALSIFLARSQRERSNLQSLQEPESRQTADTRSMFQLFQGRQNMNQRERYRSVRCV